jgi:hypothetical protein
VAHVGQEVVLGARERLGLAQLHLQFARALDDGLARLEAQRTQVALVVDQLVRKCLEIRREFGQFVAAARGARLPAFVFIGPTASAGCFRQLGQRLDHLALQQVSCQQSDQAAEQQCYRCLQQSMCGVAPDPAIVDQDADRAR